MLTTNSTFGSLITGRSSTACAVSCTFYSQGETVQTGHIRYAQKATRQNQVVLTELQALISPQHYFREASDSDSFESYQLSIAPLQEPITTSALQQTVGKLVSDLNKVDE